MSVERQKYECSALPKGWQREEVIRKSGLSAGKIDVYYYSPSGKKFRSKPQMARYLGDVLDLSTFDFRTGKINSLLLRKNKKQKGTQFDYSGLLLARYSRYSTKGSKTLRLSSKRKKLGGNIQKRKIASKRSVIAYDEKGILVSSGKDMCDCMNVVCPGCHFPCSRCQSAKCGHECRVNRKWTYEDIEVDGTYVVIKMEESLSK